MLGINDLEFEFAGSLPGGLHCDSYKIRAILKLVDRQTK
jgi:hypothetical protein